MVSVITTQWKLKEKNKSFIMSEKNAKATKCVSSVSSVFNPDAMYVQVELRR